MSHALPWPIQNIPEWLPVWQAAGFFLATFILEDVATVGAGWLLATGAVGWPVAFGACFLGIWLGDAGLYALARLGGRKWFERSSLRRFSANVAVSERWFADRGTAILIFSRMVPGARLPTYLAAGFLRVPLPGFLFVTGAAAFVWTLAILWLAQTLGARVVHRLDAFKHAGLILTGAVLAVFIAIRISRRLLANFEGRRVTAWLGRWQRWEFWPAWLFYPPVGAYCLWLAVKYRGLALPTAANPGIFAGGMVGESKMATLQELFLTSPEFTAEAELIAGDTLDQRMRSFNEIRARLGLDFPLILKPDIGQRGAGIKLVRSVEQAEACLRQTSAPLIVQRYVPGPHEAGIFYYRFPHESRGRIFAITEKLFPVVIGDGRSTLSELVWRDPRARFMAAKYLSRFHRRRDEVLAGGEKLRLVEAGNHAQGCIFRDGMRLCTPELEARIDEISQKITGFCIGRYDIRHAGDGDLRAGKNFQIIELNGAASEATSIYDARNSVFTAYRTLFRQWDLVFAIGAANRRRGCAPTRLSLVWHKWREYAKLAATYPAAD
jgi:membrane protein DedA with SNARE-associated domain